MQMQIGIASLTILYKYWTSHVSHKVVLIRDVLISQDEILKLVQQFKETLLMTTPNDLILGRRHKLTIE